MKCNILGELESGELEVIRPELDCGSVITSCVKRDQLPSRAVELFENILTFAGLKQSLSYKADETAEPDVSSLKR